MTIYTIGHSVRSFDDFVALLDAHQIDRLADIRTVPRSRRHPQFSKETLAAALEVHGIAYRHFPGLGGLRKPVKNSSNRYWRNESFRGYADYMQTEGFTKAVDDLLAFADDHRAAVMCAEAVWWRCHRALLADALVARGLDVRHILSRAPAQPHQLCEHARIDGLRITYVEDAASPEGATGNRSSRRRV